MLVGGLKRAIEYASLPREGKAAPMGLGSRAFCARGKANLSAQYVLLELLHDR